MKSRYLISIFSVACIVFLNEQAHATAPAKDLNANLEIRPSAPTANWPSSGQSGALAPNYTATVNVNVIKEEKVGKVNYKLSSGPTASTSSSDSNVIWTGVASSTNFSITNTAADTASASLSLSCVWAPEKTEGSKGNGGSGGTGPADIRGKADANVQLLDSVVIWSFERTCQWADGNREIGFQVTVTDSNGFGLERWTSTGFTAAEALPANPGWEIVPASKSVENSWVLSASARSNTPSKGKIRINYNDGSAEERTSSQEIVFFRVEFTTPTGDPQQSPILSGEGQNMFLFTAETNGGVAIGIKAKVSPPGIAGSLTESSFFSVDGVQGASLQWDAAHHGGKPTSNNNDLLAKFSYPGLTVENQDIGLKKIKYTYENEALVTQTFYLLPVKVAIRKQGTPAASEDGLIVKKGDVLEVGLATQLFDADDNFESLITWQYRRLKGDGSYTEWAALGANGKGTKFQHTTIAGGIFQVKAIIINGGEHQYVRKKDAPYGLDSGGTANPIYKKGQSDYVGVCNEQWQIDVRNAAKAHLGSLAYAKSANMLVYAGGPSTVDMPKCNIFVYHACTAAGVAIPLTTLSDGTDWPPTAKQWWSQNVTITGWTNLLQTDEPQPGYVVTRPGAHVTVLGRDFIMAGHTGILDYDGAWINAGSKTVNKFPHLTPPSGEYQPARMRKKN